MSFGTSYIHVPPSTARSIRVLELEPALDTQDEVKCTLKEVSLDATPLVKYAALSYCWEAQTPSILIRCGSSGTVLKVTKNCHDALKRLREAEEMTIWIDSICIDQTSLSDRSAQVALMGEIYRSAEKVVVWLGEWDDGLRKAVRLLKDIVGDLSDPNVTVEEAGKRQRQIHARAESLKNSVESTQDDPLGALFQKPWFTRMWTAQEVSLAKGDNIILYGGLGPENSLTWITLITAIDALQARHYRKTDFSKTIKLQKQLTMWILMKRFPSLKAVYNSKGGDLVPSEPFIFVLLVDSRVKEATDAKDKVFALYGVLRELEVETSAPDYSKPVEEIFREITMTCINNDKHLYVLYEVPSDFRHRRPSLASWVPDWSDSGWRKSDAEDNRVALLRDRFCAAGPASAKWKFSMDGKELCLSGKLFDSIIYCGPALHVEARSPATDQIRVDVARQRAAGHSSSPAQEGADSINTYSQTLVVSYNSLRAWVDISKWNERYPSGETPRQALCRTLLSDSPYVADHHSLFDGWYEAMGLSDIDIMRAATRRSSDTLSSCPPGVPEQTWLQALLDRGSPHMVAGLATAAHTKFHFMAMMYSNNKTFFITEDGYMGTAAAVVKDGVAEDLIMPGDRIALVAGLGMPLIVRPIDAASPNTGPFRLITHAYVHGIMYGEGWEDEGKILQDIVLV